jgi:hypothetical protein
LGIVKNGREKTNRRKKLNISANSSPLKANDRNVKNNLQITCTIKNKVVYLQKKIKNNK